MAAAPAEALSGAASPPRTMLSDADIERFSRQIVLPQIGGRGQERLLRATVALAGRGPLAETAALYTAGAGVGRLILHGNDGERLRGVLAEVGAICEVTVAGDRLGGAAAELCLGADAAPADIDSAVAAAQPLIAAGSDGPGGWLLDATGGGVCASCAARAARTGAAAVPLDAPAAGVLGSLVALAALTYLLGIERSASSGWRRFDARRATLVTQALESAADCPSCGAAQ